MKKCNKIYKFMIFVSQCTSWFSFVLFLVMCWLNLLHNYLSWISDLCISYGLEKVMPSLPISLLSQTKKHKAMEQMLIICNLKTIDIVLITIIILSFEFYLLRKPKQKINLQIDRREITIFLIHFSFFLLNKFFC